MNKEAVSLPGLPYRRGRGGPVLVDADGYARRKLLGGGPVPWEDPGALASYLGRYVALFTADAVLVDVGSAWCHRADSRALATAVSGRARRGRPLRVLLEDARCRALVVEALQTAVAAAGVPVVAAIPSPGHWARTANVLAGAADRRVDGETVEAAAMYIAGALSGVAGTGVSALLIDEGAATVEELPCPDVYAPIANAAGHLQWPVLVRTDNVRCWPHGPVEAVTAWVGNGPGGYGPWGVVGEIAAVVPEGSPGAPRIVRVGEDADPDQVSAAVRCWS